MATYPLDIWTINSYLEEGYTANAWCHLCKAWLEPPDLAALRDQGFGDKPLRDLGLACPHHKVPVGLTIRSTPGFGHR
jgi:hypothetical protein